MASPHSSATTANNNKLACTIMQTFTKDRPKAVVFLIDGSGSINPNDFNGPIKKGAAGIVDKLERSRIAVVQFSRVVQVATDLTGDRAAVKNAINGMVQIRNGTATKLAVETATAMLADVGSDTEKMIVIITDGVPEKGQEPAAAVEEAQKKGISIFALGIGAGVNEDALKEMSTNGQYFSIRDYDNFLLAIEEAQRMAEQPTVEIVFQPLGRELSSGEPIPVRVVITNLKAEETIPGRSKLEIQADKYFTFGQYIIPDAIGPHQTGCVDIVLRPRNNAKEFEFPGNVAFTWTAGGNVQKGFAVLATGYLRGDFVRSDDIPVNCLLFGQRGCGKSSLINALVTALTTQQTPSNNMVVAQSDTHVTTAYGKVAVSELVTLADSSNLPRGAVKPPPSEISLMLYDTWGFSDTDYKNVRIHHMIDGQIKPGTSMHEVDKKIQPASLVDAIHVVVFVIPLSAGSESSLLDGFNEHILDTIKAGLNPIVVATFIDEIENMEENERLRQRFLANLKVNGGSVFFHKNYTKHHERDIAIDLSSRNILRAIYQRANDFINIKNPLRYRNVPWFKHTIMKSEDYDLYIDNPAPVQPHTPPRSQPTSAYSSPAVHTPTFHNPPQQQYHQQSQHEQYQQPQQTHYQPQYPQQPQQPQFVAEPIRHSNEEVYCEESCESYSEPVVEIAAPAPAPVPQPSATTQKGISIDLGGKKKNVRVTATMTFSELLEQHLPASHRGQGYFVVDDATRAKMDPSARVVEHSSTAFAFVDSSMEITLMAEGLASRKVKVQGDKTVAEVLAQFTPKSMRGQDVELVDEENFALDGKMKIGDASGKVFKIQVSVW